MKRKKGEGWNDLNVEIEVNEKDLKEINEFMAPI
jgi:hypothetical protein